MLFFTGLINTWPLCLAFCVFFGGASCAAWWFPWRKWACTIPSTPIFVVFTVLWVITMGICLTFVDSPYLNLSKAAIDWLFMLFAFLGIPLTIPLLTGAVWALAHGVRGERTGIAGLLLVMLAGFGLGCAASNIHDIAWCGIITKGYTVPYKAGGDLLAFATAGQWFGIPEEVLYDYAALGPCAAVLVIGELIFAAVCFARLTRLPDTSDSTG
ncbi:MAG TPA: hypothetical protein PLC40_05860 [Candidatus Hydrogenedentes bacterium]|nr:MAG: hypothetical protein BWY09_00105 [Candidatus Hydrogenedentes bacterium ADurb.Bin179]HOH29178.1 hypothetical protein [Candidatus Hydrogenedentota bacterium]